LQRVDVVGNDRATKKLEDMAMVYQAKDLWQEDEAECALMDLLALV
jgi:hypothetical protein